jgi:hypothetical protein
VRKVARLESFRHGRLGGRKTLGGKTRGFFSACGTRPLETASLRRVALNQFAAGIRLINFPTRFDVTKEREYPLLTISGRCRSPSRDHFQRLYAKGCRSLHEERERQQRRDLLARADRPALSRVRLTIGVGGVVEEAGGHQKRAAIESAGVVGQRIDLFRITRSSSLSSLSPAAPSVSAWINTPQRQSSTPQSVAASQAHLGCGPDWRVISLNRRLSSP